MPPSDAVSSKSPPDHAASSLERLRALSESPFEPEPPRRSVIVDAAMAMARRAGNSGLVTPHLHHGSDLDKVAYEYAGADDLWEALGTSVTPSILRDRDVIDIGCGWGGKTIRYAEQFEPRSIVGFDLPGVFEPEVPLQFARQHGVADRCSFLVGTAEHVPFDDGSFDVAIVDDVLEHVRDPEQVIRECRRVLRPGGVVIVKFPSVRMMTAHHLDRALTWPALHFLVPLRTWAAGLNHYLLRQDERASYEPFDEVVRTRYHRGVTRNLNGIGFRDFSRAVADSGLTVMQLKVVPAQIPPTSKARRLAGWIYDVAFRVPMLRERLGVTIVFVGRR